MLTGEKRSCTTGWGGDYLYKGLQCEMVSDLICVHVCVGAEQTSVSELSESRTAIAVRRVWLFELQ